MTKEELQTMIIKAILEIAPDVEEEEIELTANIQRSLEIDSFDFLKILTAMHEKTGVEVPEADYAKVGSVEEMANYFIDNL
ncbi:acyl carrier protein [Sulfurimonas marina]|uniref:Acyl carrier protein n=1 Tax=Sulfurimonas marina TaxID=2590551 RepID=A0A7M1AV54_9BACT|nr:phosphopantetheine-binding protein [Sulfurimonas marina]QOP41327.1 acyl carrier protein [Sulfurimonas marina]